MDSTSSAVAQAIEEGIARGIEAVAKRVDRPKTEDALLTAMATTLVATQEASVAPGEGAAQAVVGRPPIRGRAGRRRCPEKAAHAVCDAAAHVR